MICYLDIDLLKKVMHPSNSAIVLSIASVVVVSIQSCSPILYSATGQNVPLFKNKGEVAISGGLCWGKNDEGDALGGNIQGAVAIDSTWAVMSSLYSMKGPVETFYLGKQSPTTSNGNYVEAGLGKFKYWPRPKLTGEIFLGTGFGSIKNKIIDERLEAKFIKPFVQPSIGYGGRIFEVALTGRVGLVSFTSNTNTLSDPDQRAEAEKFFNEKHSTMVFEPGLTFRGGYKSVKGQFQYCFSSFSYHSGKYAPMYQNYISFGFTVLFSKPWKNNKPTAN